VILGDARAWDHCPGDFYLCGPAGFMAGVLDDLEVPGVATERIHTESFGPCC